MSGADVLVPLGLALQRPEMDIDFFEPEPGIRLRTATFPAPSEARGTVVILQGRTEYIEKYGEVASELTERGFQVHTFDWRGQGESSRLLSDPHKGHVGYFGDYLRDLRRFLNRLVLTGPGLKILMGHSLGGHLALRHLREHPGTFDLGVVTAPMLGVKAPLPPRAMRLVVAGAVVLGKADDYAADGPYGEQYTDFGRNRVTRDRARFEREVEQIRENPSLALGGLTWGWLRAAQRSMGIVGHPSYASAMRTPVLAVCGGSDQRVDNRATTAFAGFASKVRVEIIPDAEHEILMERDSVRDHFWRVFDAFVRDQSRA